jgi:Fe-S cluster biosynthesis and repair protein YggX
MSRTINCVVLDKEAEGLDYSPYPGDLGQRIYDNVSKEAWQRWLGHQTMLINEYRLTPIEPEARKFLETEMEKFFFGEGSSAPKEFIPPTPKHPTKRGQTPFGQKGSDPFLV